MAKNNYDKNLNYLLGSYSQRDLKWIKWINCVTCIFDKIAPVY